MSLQNKFLQKTKVKFGNRFDYSKINYVNNDTKILIHCNICSNDFWQRPRNHLNTKGCPYCSKRKQYTSEEFRNLVESKFPNKYDLSKTNYLNCKTKIIVGCKICNNFYEVFPDNLLDGHSCPICYGNKKLTTEEFVEKSKEAHGDNYDYSEVKYINATTKVKIKCNKCNNYFEQMPYAHYNGEGCPYCIKSRGEEQIEKILKENHILYFREYRFFDCKFKNTLPFDFYLPTLNKVIEFQGAQHYDFNTFFHKSLDDFKEQQQRDLIKENYCKKNNIDYLAISFRDNLNEKLEPFLKS